MVLQIENIILRSVVIITRRVIVNVITNKMSESGCFVKDVKIIMLNHLFNHRLGRHILNVTRVV